MTANQAVIHVRIKTAVIEHDSRNSYTNTMTSCNGLESTERVAARLSWAFTLLDNSGHGASLGQDSAGRSPTRSAAHCHWLLREWRAMASTTNRSVYIVSGLPRSGTSLMMQMLTRGGLSPVTDEISEADEDSPRATTNRSGSSRRRITVARRLPPHSECRAHANSPSNISYRRNGRALRVAFL